ncbi:MAG: hypothetical protein Q4P31_02465 [Andreesenia angusta]|nr:hypothetical protein [Andreesenia angusta]
MEKYLDYLKKINKDYDIKENIIITDQKSLRDKDIKVMDIITEDYCNISTMIIGLTKSIPFYQKTELLIYLNERNQDSDTVKFILDDSKIIFSKNDIKAKNYNIDMENIYNNRVNILEYIEKHSIIDYINENFANKIDLNALISEVQSNVSGDISNILIDYLEKNNYFYTKEQVNNGLSIVFKLVKSDEQAQEIEIILSNTKKHKIIYRDIFDEIPEASVINTLEAIAIGNLRNREIKFVYDMGKDEVNGIINYNCDKESFDIEEFINLLKDYLEIVEEERNNFVKHLVISTDRVLIETPEN